MATYQITIRMDNDAFADDAEGIEIARILKLAAARCIGSGRAVEQTTYDSNGNVVGRAEITD